MSEDMYYWSPSIFWKSVQSNIQIEMFLYGDFVPSLFPKLYFLTQEGITIAKIIDEFPQVNPKKLKLFILDLIKKNILINRLLNPQELFYTQGRMYKNEYDDKLLFDMGAISAFKKEKLNRKLQVEDAERVDLSCDFEYDKTITERRSVRKFDENNKIPFLSLSKVLTILRQIKEKDKIRNYYASAGGLYPIDIFLYVKEDRVENLEKGVYYYCPSENSLYLVNPKAYIESKAHLFFNKDIFESSAFSIYMFYDADVSMPKYKGNAYFYACLDTGIIVSALNYAAETVGIGMCSIGEMDFNLVRSNFNLHRSHIYLHTIEAGLKCMNS
ncbi:SagB/ThcOx family dehydrogenase [Anaeromicropila populeti]|uniref:SagB/ThcOx family dehydrogenase n=1 Tax=Anaeromicropila populeti TaxID=37658 RepID=UPI0015A6ACD5|nr:SagB/ThcOx family dehydrogenase [Anaeromicropila populeti]